MHLEHGELQQQREARRSFREFSPRIGSSRDSPLHSVNGLLRAQPIDIIRLKLEGSQNVVPRLHNIWA
jgi:hypothetical protein